MSDSITVEHVTAHNRSSANWVRYLMFGGILALVIGIVSGMSLWFRPTILGAYNIEQAGRLMDVGLKWPEPRVLDSLPLSRNDQALAQALGHLAAAMQWQPDSVHAYRLAARIYAAQQAWPQAAEALDTAQALDKDNALLAWERALIYEQIWRQLRAAPGETLVPALDQAEVVAPSTPIETPFCQDGRPESCYSARTTFSQPLATQPEGPEIEADVIFLHPPAELHLVQSIPQAQSTLFFLIGLDPRAREWGSDGAGFQVLVQDGGGPATAVYEATLDAETARRGWTAATVDLAPWAGKTVTLILRTTAGSAHNTTADWYGWGNITLLAAKQAQLALLMPEARVREAWALNGIVPSSFRARAEEALRTNRYASAISWNERDSLFNNRASTSSSFAMALAATLAGQQVPDGVAEPRVYAVRGRTRIEAEALQYLSSGESLSAYPADDPTIGVMWGNSVAVAIIDVPEAARYRLTLRAQHVEPAPIELQVEHNGAKLAQFMLDRADQSWQELVMPVELEHGRHLIGVRFLNDAVAEGVDRNAVLDWLEVEKLK